MVIRVPASLQGLELHGTRRWDLEGRWSQRRSPARSRVNLSGERGVPRLIRVVYCVVFVEVSLVTGITRAFGLNADVDFSVERSVKRRETVIIERKKGWNVEKEEEEAMTE